MQVELAHGGRGPSSSDRRGGYGSGGGSGGGGSGGGRFGISRHSEYRGESIWRVCLCQKGLGEHDGLLLDIYIF